MNEELNHQIAMIVDRDTPPDNRNEVIDHDLAGKPITRGMVDAWAKTAKDERARKAQIKRNGGKR